MNLLSRRCMLAIAAVVDVALHARPTPVAAKALAARHKLPPRHLETLLQGLVHANILKGVRGPRGGYELARSARPARRSSPISTLSRSRPCATMPSRLTFSTTKRPPEILLSDADIRSVI